MSELDKKILQARPSLKKILPVVFWQTAVFSALNIALAAGIFLWKPTIFPLVAPNLFWLHIWAVLFATIGILLAHGLLAKHWEMLRAYMCVGLLYKLLWSVALFFRIKDGGTFLVAVLFVGLALLQAVVIIFYLPPDEAIEDANERLT